MKKATVYTTVFGEGEIGTSVYETGFIPDLHRQEMNVVNVYPQKRYQVIEGFGGALTEAAGYALAQMSPENRRKVAQAYYGKDGIGYTLGRVHMDSSDFCLSNYCAVKEPGDPEFADFCLERDEKYVQPLIREVSEALGRPVPLLLSPWSPPAFMKDTGVRNGGGHLKRDCYQQYADYMVRYIKEYQKRGLLIESLTIQNEPLAVQLWDSCEYSSAEEKEFLRDHLYPALCAAGLGSVAVYIWDHNKERVYERACEIVDDTTEDMIAGIAFHWYSGDHFEGLRMVQEDFPDLKLMHSEGCVELARYGAAAGDPMSHARRYAHDIFGDLNNGMNRWIDWNLAVDEQGGPNHVKNFCGAPVVCDTKNDLVEFKPMFYAIAHFSKYIRPGAVRIGCSSFSSQVEHTAAQNPDGTCVLVLMNSAKERQLIHIRIQGDITRVVLPGESMATVVIERG